MSEKTQADSGISSAPANGTTENCKNRETALESAQIKSQAPEEIMSLSVKKLLIVDDSRVSRMMVRTFVLLKHPQWIITEAASGDEALQSVERDKPDYCTMDINMPGIPGTDAAEKILDKHPDIRIAILSADIQESQQSRAAKLGAHFVAKPVTEKSIALVLAHFGDRT